MFKIKSEISKMRKKYDPGESVITKETLQRYVKWSKQIIAVAPKVNSSFETFFRCEICGSIATDPLVIQPCDHVFCELCYHNQDSSTECPSCGRDKESTIRIRIVTRFVGAFEEVMDEFNKICKLYKACQGDPNERGADEFDQITSPIKVEPTVSNKTIAVTAAAHTDSQWFITDSEDNNSI